MSLHFETEYLYIEPLTIEDSMFILELVNTPDWLKFIGDRNVRNQDYAIAYINRTFFFRLPDFRFFFQILMLRIGLSD